MPLVLF